MTNGFFTLKKVLEGMDSGERFSIVFVTYDRKKRTGGRLIRVKEAYKSNFISYEDRKQQERLYGKKVLKKNPNHFKNSTRNITIASNGEVRKVHIRLIMEFNNMKVL